MAWPRGIRKIRDYIYGVYYIFLFLFITKKFMLQLYKNHFIYFWFYFHHSYI